MHRTHELMVHVALVMVVAACESSLVPGDVELRTEVAPAVVDAGDTVSLRAIMHNPTSTSIEVGRACGPPVLFELRRGVGDVVHPIALDAPFICPYLDYHLLEPNETDTVLIRWRVDLTGGNWSVRSGFRDGADLVRLTPAARMTVR